MIWGSYSNHLPQNPMGKYEKELYVFYTSLKTLVDKTEGMTCNMSWIPPVGKIGDMTYICVLILPH